MKKSIFASVIFALMDVILAIAIILTTFPVTDLTVYAETVSGTAIRTADQLMNMKVSGNYYLANDIDLSNVKWRPISGFYGTFNGNNHEITGLTSETYGLFSSLKTGAEIKNVKLTNVYITSKYKSVGAIASVIQSGAENISIDNCFVSGLVSSCRTKYGQNANSGTVGSIVGVNYSAGTVISNCYSNAVVASERTVGGIAGTNKGTIENCGFGGQIGSAYNVYELGCDKNGNKNEDYKYLYCVGGIAGFNYGKINNCFSNCTRVDVATYYGGIVGVLQSGGSIKKCVNSSDVLYDDNLTGGLIAGYASKKSSISDCYTKNPTNSTVSSDVGKGKQGTVTYGVSAEKYGKISSFKRLSGNWVIYNGAPILEGLEKYVSIPPIYEIKGERLITISQSVPEEDDDGASVDYGYDAEGNILE